MKLAIALLLCSMFLGCGYGSSYNNTTGGTTTPPHISQLSPASATSGGPAFTLTITGTNFTNGSTVYWGTTPLAAGSTYSATQVTTSITSAMIAGTGSVSVYVHTAGGNSNMMTFTIN